MDSSTSVSRLLHCRDMDQTFLALGQRIDGDVAQQVEQNQTNLKCVRRDGRQRIRQSAIRPATSGDAQVIFQQLHRPPDTRRAICSGEPLAIGRARPRAAAAGSCRPPAQPGWSACSRACASKIGSIHLPAFDQPTARSCVVDDGRQRLLQLVGQGGDPGILTLPCCRFHTTSRGERERFLLPCGWSLFACLRQQSARFRGLASSLFCCRLMPFNGFFVLGQALSQCCHLGNQPMFGFLRHELGNRGDDRKSNNIFTAKHEKLHLLSNFM